MFDIKYIEYRAPNDSITNLYEYMTTIKPSYKIIAFSDLVAGHVTHHAERVSALYGLEIREIPFDYAQMDVDLEVLVSKQKRCGQS